MKTKNESAFEKFFAAQFGKRPAPASQDALLRGNIYAVRRSEDTLKGCIQYDTLRTAALYAWQAREKTVVKGKTNTQHINSVPAPCPFCGSTKAKVAGQDEWWQMLCDHCQAAGPPAGCSEDAEKYWNNRYEIHPSTRTKGTGVQPRESR